MSIEEIFEEITPGRYRGHIFTKTPKGHNYVLGFGSDNEMTKEDLVMLAINMVEKTYETMEYLKEHPEEDDRDYV